MSVRVSVEKESLVKAVRRCVSALNGSATAQKINFFVARNKQGVLKLGIVANGTFFANFLMDVEAIGAEGEISVNLSKDILTVVNAVAPLGEEVELSFEDSRVGVSCGQGTAYVNYINDDGKMPEIPPMIPLGSITLSIADFKKGINSVMHAVDPHEKAHAYGWNNCIGMNPVTDESGSKLHLIGSSGAAIASSTVDVAKSTIKGEIPALTVPSDSLNSIASNLDGEKVSVNIMAKKSDNLAEAAQPTALIIMDGEGASYIVFLLQQKYPVEVVNNINDYAKGAEFKVTAKKADLINAIKVANIQKADAKIKLGVGISVNDGKLRIDSFNSENYADVDSTFSGVMDRTVLAPYFLERSICVAGDDITLLTNSKTGRVGENCSHVFIIRGENCQTLLVPIDTAAVEESLRKATEKAKKAAKAKKEEENNLEGVED